MSLAIQRLAVTEALKQSHFKLIIVSLHPEATLPEKCKSAPLTMLNVEPGNPRNNQELTIEDDCLTALMSFDRAPFRVRIPFAAIHAIVTETFSASFAIEEREEPKPSKPHLRLV